MTISITINGKKYKAKKNQTILSVLRENKIYVPALCYHPDLCVKSNCRLCVVSIKGRDGLYTSCSTKVEDGMEVITESPEILRTIRTNLELIFAQHKEECADCIYRYNCELLKMAKKYEININRFKDRKIGIKKYRLGDVLVMDPNKCINCGNCVEVCHKQKVDFWQKKEINGFFEVMPNEDKTKNCVYCGQCVIHCPVGAIEAKGEFEDIEKPLENKALGKKVVFMVAPAIRSTIGEEFGLEPGTVVTGKLAAAIKKLGADYVLDVSVGADFTTTEEAKELVQKFKNKEGVCLSSCCPAWVRYVECNYPEFVKNIATTRPPHIIMGGLVKSYFAKQIGVKPENIVTVSVMPCTAKIYEIKRKEFEITSPGSEPIRPVDYVLTTRQLAFLLHKNNINLAKIEEGDFDNLMGEASGAGVIYGASGGVLEAALRNVAGELKEKPPVVFVSGLNKAKQILEELKEDPDKYAGVEVMACPGGCVGGGGQSVPTNKEIVKKRAEGLRSIDNKKTIKRPKDNPIVAKIYKDFLKTEKIIKKYCHANEEN
jgi:NADP-reducing hydrogenase subunit HndD